MHACAPVLHRPDSRLAPHPPPPPRPLPPPHRGQAVTLHAHAARESGHVSALCAVLDPKTGEVQRARPRCLLKGQTGAPEHTTAPPPLPAPCRVPLAARKRVRLGSLALRPLRGASLAPHPPHARALGPHPHTPPPHPPPPACVPPPPHAAVLEVTPSRPLCLELYSSYRSLGRVALRDGGRTLAVGIVVGMTPAAAAAAGGGGGDAGAQL